MNFGQLVMAATLLLQSTYGTIRGTIEDATKALIPGVTVTAMNTATGVVSTTLTNEAGAYNFPSLPQCAALAATLASLCALQAIADASTGQILLQNPLPGHRGSLGQYVIRGPLLPRIDGNLSKSIHITETKTLQLRIDAYNLMNHPLAAAPSVNINGTGMTAFGTIVNKTGQRRFQGMLRINF